MIRVVALLFLAGCATQPAPSSVMVEPDPISGAATAYATVFLADDGTRIVLSAPVGQPAPVRVVVWLPTDAVSESCDTPAVDVDGHVVEPAAVEARVLETPSGADQTVVFELPPVIASAAADRGATVHACGGSWALDDEDRAVFRDFLEATRR